MLNYLPFFSSRYAGISERLLTSGTPNKRRLIVKICVMCVCVTTITSTPQSASLCRFARTLRRLGRRRKRYLRPRLSNPTMDPKMKLMTIQSCKSKRHTSRLDPRPSALLVIAYKHPENRTPNGATRAQPCRTWPARAPSSHQLAQRPTMLARLCCVRVSWA